jgi:hypothetical protein
MAEKDSTDDYWECANILCNSIGGFEANPFHSSCHAIGIGLENLLCLLPINFMETEA